MFGKVFGKGKIHSGEYVFVVQKDGGEVRLIM
jgi:hypothetical protein